MIAPSDRGAWRELEARLRPFVAGRGVPAADVDDVVQEIFARIQRGVGQLRDDERFGPWVYRLARSAVADRARAERRHPAPGRDGLADDVAAPEDDPDEPLTASLAAVVARFVAELPSPYREALTLTELEGLTQREAADLVGVSLSGMKSRVQRGRQRLRDELEACCAFALDARGRVIACAPRADGRGPADCCT